MTAADADRREPDAPEVEAPTSLVAEHRLIGTAVESAAEAVFITDAEGTLEYVNGVFEAMTGYDRRDVLGRGVSVLASGVHDQAFFENLWSTISTGRVFRGRIVNRRRDGSIVQVDTTITPLRDPESGEITHYVAFQRDVTRSAALAEDRARMDRLDSLGRLAGGVAHALNNMLAVVRASADLALIEAPHGTVLQRQLLEINNAASSAAELTRHLLAFGRRQTLQLRTVDVGELCQGSRGLLSKVLGPDIELDIVTSSGVWPVTADAKQIEYALVNLAVNSRRAMPQGGTFTVAVSNRTIEDGEDVLEGSLTVPGDYVLVSVSDTGHGMDPEVRRHAFEPFFTTKRGVESAGLGLASVYGIVAQSGGRVGLASEPGRGTTVRLYLPRTFAPNESGHGSSAAELGQGEDFVAAADLLAEGTAITAEPVTGAAIARAPSRVDERERPTAPVTVGTEEPSARTILIVEDYAAVRRAAQRSLERVGYRVLTAEGEADALRIGREHEGPIDLILSDVMLGDDRGPEVVRKLQQIRDGLRVLFMSGYVGDDGRGLVPPHAPFIAKPFSFESLCEAVEAALEAPVRVV